MEARELEVRSEGEKKLVEMRRSVLAFSDHVEQTRAELQTQVRPSANALHFRSLASLFASADSARSAVDGERMP
eukprot:877431-Rhodomonas_salina.1